jgi:anti-sigma-K factor RskA
MTATHDVWLERAAAYALGALDNAESAQFTEHLGECEQCQNEVRVLSDVAGLLAFAPVEVVPPPGLRDRIMAAAAQEGGTAAGARQDGIAAAGQQAASTDAPRQDAPPTGEPRSLPAAPRRAPGPPARAARSAAPTPIWKSSRAWTAVAWVAAAASIVVAVSMTGRYYEERDQRVMIGSLTTRLRADIAARDSTIAERDATLRSMLGAEVQVVDMRAPGRTPSGRIFLNRRTKQVILAAFSIQPAAPGRIYQLWGLVDGGKPVSLGTFNTSAAGEALETMPLPAGLAITASAITDEPAGGSLQPTTTPFLVASWKATE